MPMASSESGLAWWEAQVLASGGRTGASEQRVSFRAVFFPALLRACEAQALPPELSFAELRVLVLFCLGGAARALDAVSKQDFLWFLARFGPLEQCIQKLLANFCVDRELAPWFHGTMGRSAAERVLTAPKLGDGAFLLRFSESHPTKFTLSYLKEHPNGRREVKNCLMENVGREGYALLEGGRGRQVQQRMYKSIQSFVQLSGARLKHGVPSELAIACNRELAELRAICDHQADSYTAFSSETVDMPDRSPQSGSSLLFTRSPVLQPQRFAAEYGLLNHNVSDDSAFSSSNYSGFSLDALSSIPCHHGSSNGELPPPVDLGNHTQDGDNSFVAHLSGSSSDYGNFSSFADLAGHAEAAPHRDHLRNGPLPRDQRSPPPASDAYATFDSLATTFAAESRELAARREFTVSLLRSPTRQNGHAWSSQHDLHSHETYSSFTSASVSKSRSAPLLPVSVKPPIQSATDDYGSFVALAEEASMGSDAAPPRAEWESMLGPPPPPPTPQYPQARPSTSPNDVYGSFMALSVAEHSDADTPQDLTEYSPSVSPSASLPDLHSASEIAATADELVTVRPELALAATIDPSASLPDLSQQTTKSDDEVSTASALEHLNAGMEFYKQKQLDDAILRFAVAQEIARDTQDEVVEARALGNLGTVYLDKQNPQQAVKCYEKCLEITRSIGDTKRERTILNNLVLAFVACDELEEALAYCQVQLETTSNELNRRKIVSRMSLLRERMARAGRAKRGASAAFAA